MKPEASTRRQEIATGAMIVSGAVGIFLAGQVAAWSIGLVQEPRQDDGATPTQMMALFHAVDGMELAIPGAASGDVRINSLGFRGPELPMPKPAGTVRIAFTGDSRTFDWLAEDEARTWPARAAQAMGKAFSRCAVDYVNASGPLYGTRELLRLEPRMAATSPDIALVMAGDVAHDSAQIAKRNGLAPDAPRTQGLGDIWPVWNRVERFVGLLFLNTVGLLSEAGTEARDAAWVSGFEERLTELVQKLQRDAKLVVLVQSGVPPQSVRRPTGFAALHLPWRSVKRLSWLQADAMARVAARTGALLVDADAAIPFDRGHFDNAMHLREAGREKMVALLGGVVGPAAANALRDTRACVRASGPTGAGS